MRVKVFALAAFLAAGVSLLAQENEKVTYSNVTEFGFSTASPQGISLEATTAHGVIFNKTHLLGLGVGIGMSFHNYNTAYMPIFFNYRLYFKPNSTFSPHLNVAVGGIMPKDGVGIYSAITMGFKAGHFSFSSGLSFTPIYRTGWDGNYYYDDYCFDHYYSFRKPSPVWYFPFGMTLKVGFAF
jgi:hypothetical protein